MKNLSTHQGRVASTAKTRLQKEPVRARMGYRIFEGAEITEASWKELRIRILERSEWRCWYCGEELTLPLSKYTKGQCVLEHQTPVCRGGADSEANLVAACTGCNSRKGKLNLEEYRRYAGGAHGAALFTEKQKEFWSARGIELPSLSEEYIKSHIFFGEAIR